MTYTPEYVPGKIVICLKEGYDEDFLKQLLKPLKYSYEGDVFGGVCLYNVPIGKEKSAIKKISKYKQFIDWAELYDEKLDSRFDAAEELSNLAGCVSGVVESDEQFIEGLDAVIKYAKDMKKKNFRPFKY
jgi:hypothetical protein